MKKLITILLLLTTISSLAQVKRTIKVQVGAGSGGAASGDSSTYKTNYRATQDSNTLRSLINLKAPIASPTFTGVVTMPTPFTLGATSVTPTGTEFNYLGGVTSAIQTQLNGKSENAHTHTFASLTSKPTTLSGYGITDALSSTLTNGNLLIGNGSNIATAVTPTGDITFTNAGVTTIGAAKVGVSKMTLAANSLAVNATGSAAAPTEVVWQDVAYSLLTITETWTGTTAPSSPAHYWSWEQIGKTVRIRIYFNWGVASSNTSQFTFPLPAGLPTPAAVTGATAANSIMAIGVSAFSSGSTLISLIGRSSWLAVNSAANGYIIGVQANASNNHKNAWMELSYKAQ